MKKELILSLLCLFGLFKSYGAESIHSRSLSKKCVFRPITPDIDTQEALSENEAHSTQALSKKFLTLSPEELDGDEDIELTTALATQTHNEEQIKKQFTGTINNVCIHLKSQKEALKRLIKDLTPPQGYHRSHLKKIHKAISQLHGSCFNFHQLNATYKKYINSDIFYFQDIKNIITFSLENSLLQPLMYIDTTKELEFQKHFITSGNMSTQLQKDLQKPLDALFENIHKTAYLSFIWHIQHNNVIIQDQFEDYIKNMTELSKDLALHCTRQGITITKQGKNKKITTLQYFGATNKSSHDKLFKYVDYLELSLKHPLSQGCLKTLLQRLNDNITEDLEDMPEEQENPFWSASGFLHMIQSILEKTDNEMPVSDEVATHITTLIQIYKSSILPRDFSITTQCESK